MSQSLYLLIYRLRLCSCVKAEERSVTLRAPVGRAEGGHFVKALVGWAVFPAGLGGGLVAVYKFPVCRAAPVLVLRPERAGFSRHFVNLHPLVCLGCRLLQHPVWGSKKKIQRTHCHVVSQVLKPVGSWPVVSSTVLSCVCFTWTPRAFCCTEAEG